MEFSEYFGFFKILNESIKLVAKNGRFMALITMLSLLLPSILLLLFNCFYQFLINNMTDSTINSSDLYSLIIIALLFVVEIVPLLLYIEISKVSGIATILVSAMSYTDKNISLQDLLHRVKTTWTRQRSDSFHKPKNRTAFAFVGVLIVAFLAILYPNPLTIFIAIVLGISVLVFRLYSYVVWGLYHVVSTVEDIYDGTEALEKAQQLAQGQKHHGFMMNLFFNFLFLIISVGVWMMLGDQESLNLTVYGLPFVILLSMGQIIGSTTYTVLYFQCKKFHGQDIDVLGNFEYSKLPASSTDIA